MDEKLDEELVAAERRITYAAPNCAWCYSEAEELFWVPGGRLACATCRDREADREAAYGADRRVLTG